MRLIIHIALILTLAACAPRGKLTFHAGAGEVGEVQRIFVGTTRDIDETGFPSGKRGETLMLGSVDVSIPPDREPGSVIWPNRKTPDPQKHFLVDDFAVHETKAKFQAAIQRELRSRTGDARVAVIFVHGFNNRFSEGLYRFAQLVEDLNLPFLPVHYSWPSAGHPLGYGYDRDSMLFARDGLETLIETVSQAGAKDVLLVGHSMGALLTMESLRQLSIAGKTRTLNKIGGVVLLSPDIDIDIFRQQVKRIGNLPQPFFIFSSTKDRALRLSAGLTGQSERLGNTADIKPLADLNVTLVDLSAFSDGAQDHNVAFASPAFLRLLNSIPDIGGAYGADASNRPGLLPGTVLVVQNATQLVIPNTLQ